MMDHQVGWTGDSLYAVRPDRYSGSMGYDYMVRRIKTMRSFPPCTRYLGFIRDHSRYYEVSAANPSSPQWELTKQQPERG